MRACEGATAPRAGMGALRQPRVYPILLGLIAAGLVYGGARLVLLSGSPYYLLAGLALIASAVLLWRGRAEGAILYAGILLATIAWSLWEVGIDAWALMPRIVAWLVVGAWMMMPGFRRRLLPWAGVPAAMRNRPVVAFAIGLAVAAGLGLALHQTQPARFDPRFQNGTEAFPEQSIASAGSTGGDWQDWGRDKAGTRFSPLGQITPANVAGLKRVWSTSLSIDPKAQTAGMEAVPLMVGDGLYTCNGNDEVFALDAETGHIRWQAATAGSHGATCRGVAHYKVPGATGPCADRILIATGVATLDAFDMATGHACPAFGKAGRVDLLAGLTKAPRGYYYVTSAPQIIRGRVVIGGWVTDGQYWGEPSGVIRAFDAVTGQLAWAWDMGHPDRTGPPPPGDTYTRATPNSWAPISADEDLGLVYLPMGNATPDYFGGYRRPFDEKYSSSVVAIDATSGRVRWSYQITHHDVWDYDVASQPTLVDLPMPGGMRKALIQPTKRGEIFVLDRATGEPLRKVEERPVPTRGAVPEERISPTQPFSVGMPSLRLPNVVESDMWGLTPLDQLACRVRFRQARYDGPMTPPGLTPWITAPGTVGGMNWGSASIDLDHRVMIVTSGKIAHYSRLITRAEADARGLKPARADESLHKTGGPVPQSGLPYGADISFFLSPLYTPCQAPPYGYITAIDLVSGKLIWSNPLGSARDSGPLGMPTMLPLPLGTPLIGGSITTRGGLIFVAATMDRTIRALDLRSGRMLWSSSLPHGGFSTPMTYVSPKTGKQFVVISTGSLYGLGRPDGAEIVAFALEN